VSFVDDGPPLGPTDGVVDYRFTFRIIGQPNPASFYARAKITEDMIADAGEYEIVRWTADDLAESIFRNDGHRCETYLVEQWDRSLQKWMEKIWPVPGRPRLASAEDEFALPDLQRWPR
jgi:hypothetical protein